MKKLSYMAIPSACASLLIAGGLSASAQTVIWSDNFPGSAQNLDTAPTTGISGINGGAGGALPQSAAIEHTLDGSGNLQLLTPGGSGSGDSGYIRFGTVGSPSSLYDWAASPGASAITAAGGMSISFLWTPNNSTSDNWLFVEAGAKAASQTSGGYGYSSPIFDGGNSGGVLLKNNGGSAYINNGGSATSGGTFSLAGSHAVTVDLAFTSFAVGAPVTLTAIVDGSTVLTDSFTWLNSQNYLNIGTYQESNLIGPITITTVPEPTTWAIMASGFAMVFGLRRSKRL